MMKDNLSPEEKLLRLIKNGKDKNNSPALPQGATAEKKISQIAPTPKPLSKKSFVFKFQFKLTPALIKMIILTVGAASLILLMISFIYPLIGLKNVDAVGNIPQDVNVTQADQKQEIKPYDFYLQGTKGRQIFSVSVAQEGTGKPATAVNADLVKNINLLGVITGDNPQAIIEDRKTRQTFYLNKGQFIGELKVDDIQEGKVILEYKGQRYELYM